MLKKPCCSRFLLHKFVHLKFFWTPFKNVHLRGPCSSRLCISRPYCTYSFIEKIRIQDFSTWNILIQITTAKPFVSCYISWFEFWYIHWFVHGNWQNVLTIIQLKLHRSCIGMALKTSKLIFISKKTSIISKFLETSWVFFLWRVSDNS